MMDMEKLRDDAAEWSMLAIETDDKRTREIFIRLAEHLTLLANQAPVDTFLGHRIHGVRNRRHDRMLRDASR